MGTGTHSNSGSCTYLSVGFGKFRQKNLDNREPVGPDTPGAVLRKTNAGKETWAIEYDYVEGLLEKIFYKEDPEYGNSFEVVIADGPLRFQASFKDDNRFWFDLAKKLPNVDVSIPIKLTAYDFEDKKEHKRHVGMSVEQVGVKVESFYSKKGADGKWEELYG